MHDEKEAPVEAIVRRGLRRESLLPVIRWFDSWAGLDKSPENLPQKVEWLRSLPFMAMHVACLGVIWVGWSPVAVAVAAALYAVRMFAITGFYHRYFSHNAFKISRAGQLVFAVVGTASVQRGPLWWAAHHRHHHQVADRDEDVHSPVKRGFSWSHVGWIMSRANFQTRLRYVPDLARFPELRFLDRFDLLVAVTLALSLFLAGEILEARAPALGTSGGQMLVWGFFISTVVLYHATFTINSLAHMFGSRRYDTPDGSRNNLLLALITFGEGWHNNHHHCAVCARQGFFWWEVDLTYYLLRLMAAAGIVKDIRGLPPGRRDSNLVKGSGGAIPRGE